jgi:sulfonate transport system permease protein
MRTLSPLSPKELASGDRRPLQVRNSRSPSLFLSLLLPLLILVFWEAAVGIGWWPKTLVAPPLLVAEDFLRLLMNGALLRHGAVSLYRLLVGFLAGSALGVLMGSLAGLSRRFEQFFAPTLRVLAPVPPIAWIPLLIIVLGIGDGSKIALIAIGAFFVLFLNTFEGIRNADQNLVEVARLYRKTPVELWYSVLLPSATPNILAGLRIALAMSWILLIAAEVIASSEGLGWLVWNSRNFSRPDDMIVGMIAIGLLGGLSDFLLGTVGNILLFWRDSFQGE